MNRYFIDTESGTVYTLSDLEEQYNTLTMENPEEYEGFTFYLWLLEVTGKNGTLEEYHS